MGVFSSSIRDHNHVKPLLDGLWQRLQDISYTAEQLDRSALDEDDQTELDAIARITFGYAHFVIECSSMIDDGEEPPLAAISEFSNLINAHCDDSSTALGHVLKLQSGRQRQSVRVH